MNDEDYNALIGVMTTEELRNECQRQRARANTLFKALRLAMNALDGLMKDRTDEWLVPIRAEVDEIRRMLRTN